MDTTPSRAGLVRQGIEFCRNDMWDSGLRLLEKAFKEGTPESEEAAVACSYLGYGVAFHHGRIDRGLDLCVRAIGLDDTQAEVFLNAARTYLLAGNRHEAVNAVDRGLRLDPQHWSLKALREELGIRKPTVIPALPRSHLLNRWLGRRRHEKKEGTKR